jgi:hypothetical protein
LDIAKRLEARYESSSRRAEERLTVCKMHERMSGCPVDAKPCAISMNADQLLSRPRLEVERAKESLGL